MDNVVKSKEYALLLREHKDLVAEHERLESNPHDAEAHIEHRRRLITHNKRLHDFVVLHFTGPKPGETPAAGKGRQGGASRGKTRTPARSGRRR